jgi:transcriptional regulator with XRE-family HTH domain
MIAVNELKGRIVAKGYTQEKVAEKLGITPKTLHLKLKRGVLGTDEAETLIHLLDIKDPNAIFFAE